MAAAVWLHSRCEWQRRSGVVAPFVSLQIVSTVTSFVSPRQRCLRLDGVYVHTQILSH